MKPQFPDQDLPRLVDHMLASYQADPRIQHIGKRYLPARAAVVDLDNLLLELTYPGYVGRQLLTAHNVRFHVGELLPRLWQTLCDQMLRCLCHRREQHQDPSDFETAQRQTAIELANQFVDRIPAVREMLGSDVQAAYDGDPAASGTAEVILAYPSLIAITLHRYAHELYLMDVPLMPRMMSEHAHRLTGIDIHPGARIGRSFFIDHGTGVVIGETAVIGDQVKIYQGVTLGAVSIPHDEAGNLIRGAKRHPTVGDNVTIYANAIVLGGDTFIGEGAVIGGSVFITQSVQPGHQISIAPPALRVKPLRHTGPAADSYVPTWDI